MLHVHAAHGQTANWSRVKPRILCTSLYRLPAAAFLGRLNRQLLQESFDFSHPGHIL